MYVEKYCKYKKQKTILNEVNLNCTCIDCENDACFTRRDIGCKYAYSTCAEYVAAKIDPEYKMEKERMCRMCLDMAARCLKRNQKEK